MTSHFLHVIVIFIQKFNKQRLKTSDLPLWAFSVLFSALCEKLLGETASREEACARRVFLRREKAEKRVSVTSAVLLKPG